MSKYVQMLLTYRNEIKTFDFQDVDLYDDLITVEQKIAELYKEGKISDFDLLIINYVSSGKSYRQLEKEYKISRIIIAEKFKKICYRISFYLGDYFTDIGYIKKLKLKYKLSNQEALKILNSFNRSKSNDFSL